MPVSSVQVAWVGLAFNLTFALFHSLGGILERSWWFLTLGVYYAVLSGIRFYLLRLSTDEAKLADDLRIRRFTGAALIALSVCLAGTVILCMLRDRGIVRHEIVMISIALYAFSKITLGVINLIKARRKASAVQLCLRNLSFADGLVSICSLQRSMLVSFGEMAFNHILLFNLLTGAGTCILLLLLGLNLIGGRKIDMAKSKLVNGIKQIEKGVADGYKKVEKTVVTGYKKVEKTFVDGYTKIEDKFVDQYLTHEGETVEDAKARLKKENEQR